MFLGQPSWSVQIPNTVTKTSTCTARWNPPYSVDLIVTLYKVKLELKIGLLCLCILDQ